MHLHFHTLNQGRRMPTQTPTVLAYKKPLTSCWLRSFPPPRIPTHVTNKSDATSTWWRITASPATHLSVELFNAVLFISFYGTTDIAISAISIV
ncbi:hypothetical protein NIES46_45900 [Arthrospira platensis NIES-46]|uniref:Uncharacterized protein n=1 Tax=Limnospira platensis NIES-46 TaxID=1236695 RepID=A0A5M3TES4_LIMPL|nr:hypothetical protein NIES46_45900 [Arthrospira platensis NIES-46]